MWLIFEKTVETIVEKTQVKKQIASYCFQHELNDAILVEYMLSCLECCTQM